MNRLCDRPGCSEPGAATYGMVPEELLFWVSHLATTPSSNLSVLCRRHADAMVVPRGWTLDDRREQTPRLFRPPPEQPTGASAPRRRARTSARGSEQLELATPSTLLPADETGEPVEEPALVPATAAGDDVEPWSPAFDVDDDLGGLLQVESPLLARAFRGASRARR